MRDPSGNAFIPQETCFTGQSFELADARDTQFRRCYTLGFLTKTGVWVQGIKEAEYPGIHSHAGASLPGS